MGVPGAFTMIIKEYHSSDPNLAIIKGKIAQLENPKLNNLYLDFKLKIETNLTFFFFFFVLKTFLALKKKFDLFTRSNTDT